jgi:hypothetical protein
MEMNVDARARVALAVLLFSEQAHAHSFEGWLPIGAAAFMVHLSPLLVLWERVGWVSKGAYVVLFPLVFFSAVAVAASLRAGLWPVYVICLTPPLLAWLYWARGIR